ncbi:hypothetical protein Lal_00036638 [Lupinus albus]|nr:hypothetical protein Lal_00036638 [Lupinus albus]
MMLKRGLKKEIIETHAELFKRRGVGNQPTSNSIFKKNLREEACQEIVVFFYNAIAFNVANSDDCKKIFELVIGFKPPSYHEIRVKYLKQQVDSTMLAMKEHKSFWKKVGCTIMMDGWTDKRRKTIPNFLVNSPKGTIFFKFIYVSHFSETTDKVFRPMDEIFEEVGEENVVQIVTDNAANYKATIELLMRKMMKLYWTPCVAHCIDLMLEDFEKKILIHKETIEHGKNVTTYIYSRTSLISLIHYHTKGTNLIRPADACFATSYLTLGCLVDNMQALIRMFTSNEWTSSQCAKTKDDKFIENVVIDKEFWNNIVGAYPLIKVFRLVDSNEKPSMGFIYEAMDQTKEKIQIAFNDVKKGYYLNPKLHYDPNFKADVEVKRGFYDCLTRMVGNMKEIGKIDDQLEDFKNKSKFFGSPIATAGVKTKTPSQWRESYGDEHPELQIFCHPCVKLNL